MIEKNAHVTYIIKNCHTCRLVYVYRPTMFSIFHSSVCNKNFFSAELINSISCEQARRFKEICH